MINMRAKTNLTKTNYPEYQISEKKNLFFGPEKKVFAIFPLFPPTPNWYRFQNRKRFSFSFFSDNMISLHGFLFCLGKKETKLDSPEIREENEVGCFWQSHWTERKWFFFFLLSPLPRVSSLQDWKMEREKRAKASKLGYSSFPNFQCILSPL